MRPNETDRGSTGNARRRGAPKIAVLAAALGLLGAPPAAQAITVSGTAAPTNLQAGAHSDFNIHIDFGTPGDQVKNLTVGLPPGLVGDPTATPKCSVAQLNADACPTNTVVGAVSAQASILGVVGPVPATGSLFNLDPQPGEPARFGIVLHPAGIGLVPPIILQSGAQLRPSDFGLNTVIKDIPNTTLLSGDTTITSQDITLYGTAPGTGRPFMRNPTSCAPAVTSFAATSYSGSTTTNPATAQTPAFTPTNCGALDFSPTLTVRAGAPGQTGPPGKVPVTSSIDQDPGEAGLNAAHVVVPPDFTVDIPRLTVGTVCSQSDFAAGACPPGAVIGSAVASSPLLTQPLTGPVLLVQTAGLPNVGLDLNGQLHFLLQGTTGFESAVTFAGLPDIPIAHFQLHFDGGPGGILLAGRDLCRPPAPVFHADFTGYNGATRSLDTQAAIDGCGPCPATKAKGKHKRKNRDAAAAKKKHKKKAKVCKKKGKKHKKKR